MKKTTKTVDVRAQESVVELGLTVVIPTYNGASWLPETVRHIETALDEASVKTCEVLIVNDGSTDNTIDVVEGLAKSSKYPIRMVTQKNGGRFVARRTGTEEAKYPNLLFVDTRVFIGKTSLQYIIERQAEDASRKVWCSHVRVDSKGNIYARFWETVAFVAWRSYFKNPKDTSYGIKEFDSYPKGTTCFFITKSILQDANDWFEKNTKDIKTSNDDTLLLRYIAKDNSINVSPDFWCLYHARSSLKQYTRHVFHRGKVFVDGFLRNDGNHFFIPLILFLILCVATPAAIIIQPALIVPLLVVAAAGWILELIVTLLIGVPVKDAFSTVLLTPIFAVYYGAGIWNAFVRIFILRSTRSAN